MLFVSTRGPELVATLSEAIRQGIAPDGGLYVPQRFPEFRPSDFDGAHTLADIAERLLAPFFAGDQLARKLTKIVNDAFNFPAPVKQLETRGFLLRAWNDSRTMPTGRSPSW
jgi:threonine synthase